MILDDPISGDQTQPSAVPHGPDCEKWLKDPLADDIVHPPTVVGDGDLGIAPRSKAWVVIGYPAKDALANASAAKRLSVSLPFYSAMDIPELRFMFRPRTICI